MKRSVSDEKGTHLTCTDKHASQMKHSLCDWLLFLEKIIFHLTCKQACGHFSAYLQLFVCICNVQKKHVKTTQTQQISWKRQSSAGDVVKKLLIHHIGKGCAARTPRPWVKRHLLTRGSSP